MPTWIADLSGIDFDNIFYYIKQVAEQGTLCDDIPSDINDTFDRLSIPQAEQKYLAGVTAQYESEAVYHKVREDLEKLGVIFTDMDTALRLYPDFFFQAEDGIRARNVTGVQTCALPISLRHGRALDEPVRRRGDAEDPDAARWPRPRTRDGAAAADRVDGKGVPVSRRWPVPSRSSQIGRASCRERV